MLSQFAYPVQKRATVNSQEPAKKQQVTAHPPLTEGTPAISDTIRHSKLTQGKEENGKAVKKTHTTIRDHLETSSPSPDHSGIESPRRKSYRLATKRTTTTTTTQKSLWEMLNQQATSLNKQPPTSTISIDENECIVNELPCKHPLVEKTSSTNKKVRIQPTEKAKTVETETQPKKNVALVEASTQSTEVVEIESTMDTVSDIPSMNAMNIANIINTVDTTNTKDTLDTVKPHTLAASAFMNPPIIEQSAIQRKDESIPVQTLLPIYLSTQYTDINERIEDEKLTLTRLREALDIKLTFHAAQNHPALFHKIQRSLCTSTRKNITIAHIAKIMYLVPELYLVHAKALRELGRTVEAYLIEFGKQWMSPLSGKDLQDRKDILALKIKVFFSRNSGHDATVPEAVLPKIETVVDTSKLLERANLPPSVRAVLERQEQRKEAAKAALVEKPKVVGTVKDRASALLERIRAKNSMKNK